MPKNTLVALGDYVIIKPSAAPGRTDSGLHLPDNLKQKKTAMGVAVSVGPGARATNTGELIPMNVKQGDTVFYLEYSANEVMVGGVSFVNIREHQIFASVQEVADPAEEQPVAAAG